MHFIAWALKYLFESKLGHSYYPFLFLTLGVTQKLFLNTWMVSSPGTALSMESSHGAPPFPLRRLGQFLAWLLEPVPRYSCSFIPCNHLDFESTLISSDDLARLEAKGRTSAQLFFLNQNPTQLSWMVNRKKGFHQIGGPEHWVKNKLWAQLGVAKYK